jgi:predicted Zn-dependent protease
MVTEDPYEIAVTNTHARERVRELLEANPGNAEHIQHRLATPPERPALAHLAEIQIPALLVVGEHDIPDVHAHAGAIDAGIPGAQRVVIHDAGHLVPLEQPDAFIGEVRTFLKEAPFFHALDRGGVAAAVEAFVRFRDANPSDVPFTEQRMNVEGYRRLQSGHADDAIELFKLNVQAYPESWNTYDSLAEGYMTRGDTTQAIANYEKSLELNPENTGARERIERLRRGR